MNQNNLTTQAREPDMALAAERLTHLLPSLLTCKDARTRAAELIPVLKAPADPVWVMGRIASLLNPYFEKDTPQGIRKMEAEDWAYAFEGLPKWAIDRAVRWWKSNDNTRRRSRPLEGDIVERVLIEMKFVRNAEAGLNMPAAGRITAQTATRVVRDADMKARADAIMAGFNTGKVI
jgi:hypothetical protein